MFHKECGLTDAQIDEQARQKLAKLSLKEKVWLLHGNWQMIRDSVLYKRSYNPVPIETYGSKKIGLKPIGFTDGPRGVVMGKSTAFPVSMARAASFDTDLEERIGDAIGKEARAGKANYFGGVCINLLMHPAGGRAQESYGEDPFLVGEMGASLVKGVQAHNVMACAKHYAVNNMENKRFSVNVNCSERTLREVYLPHFKKAVDAGAASLMGAYNRFRGEQASENAHLLTDILRDDWGFEGFTITDFIFALRDGAKALKAGMDIEMPIPVHFGNELLAALKDGRITEADVDRALLRRIRTQIVFDNAKDPLPAYGKELIAGKAHYALAREAAEQSMVLIKNEGVLPFSRDVRKVLLLGKLANTENIGDHGSSRVFSERIVTAVAGIRAYLGEGAEVIFDAGENLEAAKKLAAEADAVIIVAGNDYNDEGECVMPDPDSDINAIECMAHGFINNNHKIIGNGMMKAASKSDKAMSSYTSGDEGAVGGDRKSLSLKPSEIALIREAGSVNPNTVVSLVCGSMLMTAEWEDQVPAILYSWYAGVEGGTALAEILFGSVNPSGKLPFAIPADVSHLPQVDFWANEVTYDFYHGYRKLDHDGNVPAYPFGFGLSYTTYEYAQPAVVKTENGYAVSCDVRNTGSVDGREAVQVYVRVPESAVERHVKKLCGFKKIPVKAGETVHVTVPVDADELKYYDEGRGEWVLEDTVYEFGIGADSGSLHWVK